MATTNITSPNKRVIVFFDCNHPEVSIPQASDIQSYCKKNNWQILTIIHKCSDHAPIDYGFFLHEIKQHKYIGKVTVIIGKNTYELPENIISCTIFGALERLELIDVYVCNYNAQINGESKKIVLNPYDEEGKQDLIDRSIASLNHLTANMNSER